MEGVKAFELYGNLLSYKSMKLWENIIKAHQFCSLDSYHQLVAPSTSASHVTFSRYFDMALVMLSSITLIHGRSTTRSWYIIFLSKLNCSAVTWRCYHDHTAAWRLINPWKSYFPWMKQTLWLACCECVCSSEKHSMIWWRMPLPSVLEPSSWSPRILRTMLDLIWSPLVLLS